MATTQQLGKLREEEAVRVLRWRFERLVRAGYDPDDALELATHPEIDLRAAETLVRRGCPSRTAVSILV